MSKATDIIQRVAAQTDKAILFHSATGKDSIAMLDLMAPYFERILCVYMFTVPDLRCVNRYIRWAQARYQNAQFVQVPHFNVSGYVKYGYLGCATNPKQRIESLSSITDMVRAKSGISWAFYGMKEADSMNRRIMLRTYDDGVYWKGKKCYPLSLYKNKDLLKYIERQGLISPMRAGISTGESIDNPGFLAYLRDEFPDDLRRVYERYPQAERLLFEYDLATKEE